MQVGSPNHRKLRRLRAGVVSVAGKGPLSAGQVGDEKTDKGARMRALSQGAANVLPWRCPV